MQMEEKNESLKIVKKRWNWLKKHIGKSIINFFQMKDQKEEEESLLNDEEDIELLLEEANAYGLKLEVDITARQIMEQDPVLPKLEAYVRAYNEWIK